MAIRALHHLFLIACVGFAPLCAADATSERFAALALFAEMSNATYFGRPEAQAVVEAHGYRLEQFASVAGVEVSYFVATNDRLRHQVIAVRGTSNLENAIVDVRFKLLADERAGIALHQGFSGAANGVFQAAGSVLKKDYSISMTGHSLGGAVAVILAMYLDVDEYSLGPIVTFGQPKVTNVSGARRFAHLDLVRVVTARDVVPLLPPLDATDIGNLDVYWHLGRELVLLNGADYAELEGIKSMMRAMQVFDTRPNAENLEHHSMAGYVDQVTRKSRAATLVPYETGIDLFKLFGG